MACVPANTSTYWLAAFFLSQHALVCHSVPSEPRHTKARCLDHLERKYSIRLDEAFRSQPMLTLLIKKIPRFTDRDTGTTWWTGGLT